MLLFLTFYSKNPEKSITCPQKYYGAQLFSTLLIRRKQISILDWFLNDRVTLKTGLRAAENYELNNK